MVDIVIFVSLLPVNWVALQNIPLIYTYIDVSMFPFYSKLFILRGLVTTVTLTGPNVFPTRGFPHEYAKVIKSV